MTCVVGLETLPRRLTDKLRVPVQHNESILGFIDEQDGQVRFSGILRGYNTKVYASNYDDSEINKKKTAWSIASRNTDE